LHAIEYLELLAERDVQYDVVGVQLYHGGRGHWVRDMADHSALLDQFAAIGKPVHITEMQTPSSTEKAGDVLGFDVGNAGWWHRPWDPETQADWVEQIYRVAISKPAVHAVSWWSFSDRESFWPHGGLLDREDQPKPSYYRLKAMIENTRQGSPALVAGASTDQGP
jgi:GH35 family endo-1,4-beta-xylanase